MGLKGRKLMGRTYDGKPLLLSDGVLYEQKTSRLSLENRRDIDQSFLKFIYRKHLVYSA